VVLDAPGALVSTVKHAADGSGDVIVRIWESRGGRASGALRVAGGVDAAWRCDLIERAGAPLVIVDGALAVALAPFEVATYRIRRRSSTRPA
jgi:alpha-mannosidase